MVDKEIKTKLSFEFVTKGQDKVPKAVDAVTKKSVASNEKSVQKSIDRELRARESMIDKLQKMVEKGIAREEKARERALQREDKLRADIASRDLDRRIENMQAEERERSRSADRTAREEERESGKRQQREARERERGFGGPGGGGGHGGGGSGAGGSGGGADAQGKKVGSHFLRGLVQGMGLGEYFPANTGAGMGQQVFGRIVGRGTRRAGRIAGALASTPFSGLEGVGTALGGIPIAGGALQGMLGVSTGAAGAYIAAQKQEQSSAYLLGSSREQIYAARDAVLGRPMSAQEEEEAEVAARQGFKTAAAAKQEQLLPKPKPKPKRRETVQELQNRAWQEEALKEVPDAALLPGVVAAGMQGHARAYAAAREKQKQRREEEAYEAALTTRYGLNLTGAGVELMGVARPEALQFAKGVADAGGGRLTAPGVGAAAQAAMAAHTAFGVEGGTSGAFLRASRTGGITGGLGRGGDQLLVEGLQHAVRAGMEGSEIADYLDSMAQDINDFKNSGMPVAPGSIAELSRGLAVSGMGTARGAAMGHALNRGLQEISKTGPQNAAQFMAFQHFGGFKGGGGLQGLEDAQLAMERGDFFKGEGSDEKLNAFVRKITKSAGGGVAGRMGLRKVFGELGASLGVEESIALDKSANNESLDPAEEKAVALAKAQLARAAKDEDGAAVAPANVAAMLLRAASLIDKNVAAQAALENKKIGVGGKSVDAVQNLEQAQMQTASTFINTLGPTLTDFTKVVKASAGGIDVLVKALLAWLAKTDGSVLQSGSP